MQLCPPDDLAAEICVEPIGDDLKCRTDILCGERLSLDQMCFCNAADIAPDVFVLFAAEITAFFDVIEIFRVVPVIPELILPGALRFQECLVRFAEIEQTKLPCSFRLSRYCITFSGAPQGIK